MRFSKASYSGPPCTLDVGFAGPYFVAQFGSVFSIKHDRSQLCTLQQLYQESASRQTLICLRATVATPCKHEWWGGCGRGWYNLAVLHFRLTLYSIHTMGKHSPLQSSSLLTHHNTFGSTYCPLFFSFLDFLLRCAAHVYVHSILKFK